MKRLIYLFLFSLLLFSSVGVQASRIGSDSSFTRTDSILYLHDMAFKVDRTVLEQFRQPEFIPDNEVMAMLDSLARLKYFLQDRFTTDTCKLNIHGFAPGFIPVYADSVFQKRLALLNVQSPIDLVFNEHVRTMINLYAVKKPMLTARAMGLAELYFPIFEEMLDKYNMPLELKYLAVVESALNPKAISRSGAGGLWQFMYYTGKMYGLRVDSYIDERFDPYKATEAACKHLTHLFNLYKDWSLAIAAYNMGEGNLNRAIRRSGGLRDFWALRPYLPRETMAYVPSFIAVNYVMNHSADHNIFPVEPKYVRYQVDTVTVREKLEFSQIAGMLSIPEDDLYFLNPTFKQGVIPASEQDRFTLRLPFHKIGDFVNNEENLYNYKTPLQLAKEIYAFQHNIKLINGELFGKHIVQQGESLGSIANKYNCSVEQIKAWNNLSNSMIHPLQSLQVQVALKVSEQDTCVLGAEGLKLAGTANADSLQTEVAALDNPKAPDVRSSDIEQTYERRQPKYIYYTIQPGDTLWDIAKRYKTTTVSEIRELNNIDNSKNLQPGQKIKVAISG